MFVHRHADDVNAALTVNPHRTLTRGGRPLETSCLQRKYFDSTRKTACAPQKMPPVLRE
jgi:hypothetical protein